MTESKQGGRKTEMEGLDDTQQSVCVSDLGDNDIGWSWQVFPGTHSFFTPEINFLTGNL